MTDLKPAIETAFCLYEEDLITREELTHIIEQCINIVSMENGYADELGLPFPDAQISFETIEKELE